MRIVPLWPCEEGPKGVGKGLDHPPPRAPGAKPSDWPWRGCKAAFRFGSAGQGRGAPCRRTVPQDQRLLCNLRYRHTRHAGTGMSLRTLAMGWRKGQGPGIIPIQQIINPARHITPRPGRRDPLGPRAVGQRHAKGRFGLIQRYGDGRGAHPFLMPHGACRSDLSSAGAVAGLCPDSMAARRASRCTGSII